MKKVTICEYYNPWIIEKSLLTFLRLVNRKINFKRIFLVPDFAFIMMKAILEIIESSTYDRCTEWELEKISKLARYVSCDLNVEENFFYDKRNSFFISNFF